MKKANSRYCCKCGAEIMRLIPIGKPAFGLIQDVKVENIRPWCGKNNKYYCKECADKEEI